MNQNQQRTGVTRRRFLGGVVAIAGVVVLAACGASSAPSASATSAPTQSAAGPASTAAVGASPSAATSPLAGASPVAAGSPAAIAAASSPVAAASPATSASPSAAQKVNANSASIAELQQAFEGAGISNAARWAREVDEYRPYPTDGRLQDGGAVAAARAGRAGPGESLRAARDDAPPGVSARMTWRRTVGAGETALTPSPSPCARERGACFHGSPSPSQWGGGWGVGMTVRGWGEGFPELPGRIRTAPCRAPGLYRRSAARAFPSLMSALPASSVVSMAWTVPSGSGRPMSNG